MRSDKLLEKFEAQPYLVVVKDSTEAYNHYHLALSQKFFDEWGEIWQISLFSNFSEITSNMISLYSAGQYTLQIETEIGKTFVELPGSGNFSFNAHLKNFPHNLKPNLNFCTFSKKKLKRRTKNNEMSSMQQDPF